MKRNRKLFSCGLTVAATLFIASLPAVGATGVQSPPFGQDGGGRGCIKLNPDSGRPLCSKVTDKYSYEKSASHRCGGNTGYIEDPAVPGGALSWQEPRGALTRYCVQPKVFNTGSGSTPGGMQVFLVGDKDFPLTTTPFGDVRRMANIAAPIAGKLDKSVEETWCIDLPSTASAPKLSLFLNVPAQNLLSGVLQPSGAVGADKAAPSAANSASARGATVTTALKNNGTIKAYSTACKLDFADSPVPSRDLTQDRMSFVPRALSAPTGPGNKPQDPPMKK